MGAGEDAAGHLTRAGLRAAETAHEAVAVDSDSAAETLGVELGVHEQGRVGAASTVATDERAERPAAEAVAVHQHLHGATTYGQGRSIQERQVGVNVAEVRADLLGQMVQVECCGFATSRSESPQREAGDRLAGDRQKRFGDAIGERAEALAPAGGEHQRPQPGPTAEAHSSGKTISGGASG